MLLVLPLSAVIARFWSWAIWRCL